MTGTCPAGSAISAINSDGTVVCEMDDNSGGTVTAVTASAPLVSSGGTTPNITLPSVIIATNNTAIGTSALQNNISGSSNTAIGAEALFSNTEGNDNTAIGRAALSAENNGSNNTAIGFLALANHSSGNNNTAIGYNADASMAGFTNATAIGANAIVDDSDKIRLGDANVTVIEGQVAFTAVSDKNQKENFQPVDGEGVLKKIRGLGLTTWNFIGHDPKQFRHYGPVAQDFFAAFGNDGIGTIGTPTTINSGDMAGILIIAAQALEKRTLELQAENADLKARLERLEKMILAKEALARQ